MLNKVSVIIPLYNQGQYLREAIQGILQQTVCVPMEIIIVDDKSTDASGKMADDLALELVSKMPIKVIHNDQNYKLPKTRNIGINNSVGDIILCLDADDTIPDNYVIEHYKALCKGYDIVYTGMQYFGTVTSYFDPPEFSEGAIRKTNFVHCSAMYAKNVWNASGGYDEDMTMGLEDWAFWLKAIHHGFRFQKIMGTHLNYRRHAGNMLNSTKKNYPAVYAQFKAKFGDYFQGKAP